MKAGRLAFIVAPLLVTGAARAADPDAPPFDDTKSLLAVAPAKPAPRLPKDDLASYPYTTPVAPHYLRASVEVFSVLSVGMVDYLLNTQARGGNRHPGDQTWDLRYDWPTFQSKLNGENYHLDTNRFNTNYISHPLAGTLYYTAARSNHLSVLASFGYATVGAFLWEYFGELREEVSINDVIVTPVAGAAIGETLLQLSSFLNRGKKRLATDAVAALITPWKKANDWADGAEEIRSEDLDDLGFSKDVWHRFDLFAGGGLTWQRSSGPNRARTTYTDTHIGLRTQLVNLPGYDGAARRSDLFDDGNASQLRFDATMSRGQLTDAVLATEFAPAGYYWRDASADGDGNVRGNGLLVAMRAAFEYGVHDYDRDRQRPMDIVTILSPLGLTLEYTGSLGRARVRTRLDVGGELAGVASYALDTYRQAHADTSLQTVLKQQGYYHSLGVTVIPSVDVSMGPLEIGGHVRVDSFQGIEGYDEQQNLITREIPLADRRVALRAWSQLMVPRTHLTLGVTAQRLARMGSVGDVQVSQSESSVLGSLGVRF